MVLNDPLANPSRAPESAPGAPAHATSSGTNPDFAEHNSNGHFSDVAANSSVDVDADVSGGAREHSDLAPRDLAPRGGDDDSSGAVAGAGLARWQIIAWAVAVGAALAWLYGPTLQQLVLSWRDDEYYSHGPLLPFISAFLIWSNRAQVQAAWRSRGAMDNGRAAGAWILAFGLGVAFLGQVGDVNFVRAFSIPIVTLGIARFVGGGRFEGALRFPILLWAAGVPISRVVVQTFSVPLQKMAAGGASMALGLFGLPVQSQGVNIFTPRYNFVVDVPCSGLKTAIALLTVGLIVAYLLPGLSLWRRVVLAISSVGVALVANVIRIIIIVLIGIYAGREAAEGFLHGFSNIVTFGLSLALMMALGHFLRDDEEWDDDDEQAVEAAPAPAAPAPVAPAPVAPAPVAPAPVAPAMPVPRAGWTTLRWRVPATILALVLGTQLLGARAIVPEDQGPPPAAIRNLNLPLRAGAWTGVPVTVNPAVFEMLRPDVAVQKRYALGGATSSVETLSSATAPRKWVDAIVIYSRDARGFHAPEICLGAGGWTIDSKETRQARADGKTLDVTLVTGERRGAQTHLAYFFADTKSQATGWVAMLAKQAVGRVLQRNTGTTEVQFAFGADALTPGGEFSPELSRLMIHLAGDVNAQLAAKN